MNRVSAACLGSQLPGLSLRVSQPTVAWVWPASRDQLLGLVSVPSMNLEAYRTDTGVHQMWVWILPLTLNLSKFSNMCEPRVTHLYSGKFTAAF